MQNWSIKGLMRGRRALPVFVFSLAVLFIMVLSLGQAFSADSTRVPGSENDPLVTASWVEAKINERLRQLEGSGGAGISRRQGPTHITYPPRLTKWFRFHPTEDAYRFRTEIITRSRVQYRGGPEWTFRSYRRHNLSEGQYRQESPSSRQR